MSAKYNPSVPVFNPASCPPALTRNSTNSLVALAPQPAAPNIDAPKHVSRKSAGSTAVMASPRNAQSQKPQHKGSRKSSHNSKPAVNVNEGFPDSEDSLAEQYLLTPSRNRRNQVSLTHLLNFTLPPRDQGGHRRYNAPSWQKQGSHSTDKAHFVNANFRFVVHPSGDYTAQAFDPDTVIPWYLILQVLVSKHRQSSSCPICLTDDPVATRMAKCGHTFCLPCLMRMLESDMTSVSNDSGKAKKKRDICPLCLETLSLSDVKPVKWMDYPGDESSIPEAGKDVVLRLVMRKPGSILALPRDGGEPPSSTREIPWHFAAEVTHYARIMKGSEDYMTEEFEREIRELEFMEQEDGAVFGEDGEWTHKAIEMIFDSMESMKGMGNAPKRLSESRTSDRSRRRDNDVSTLSETKTGRGASSASTSRGSRSISRSQSTTEHNSSSYDAPYYFYQPRDASYTFLSALDIRILKTAFGNFSAFPSSVLVRIERISDQVVDDELRKRVKYLGHLPAGCPISILECDWTDVVKPEVLENFAEDLEKRSKSRRDKDMREERARQKALKEEEEMRYRNHHTIEVYGGTTSITDRFGDPEQFPPLRGSSLTDETVWPSLSTSGRSANTTPSTSPIARTTTVWGTPAVSFSRAGEALGVGDDGDVEEDDPWAGWDDSKLFEQQTEKSAQSGSGKKKKQKKKLVLMSTGGGGYNLLHG